MEMLDRLRLMMYKGVTLCIVVLFCSMLLCGCSEEVITQPGSGSIEGSIVLSGGQDDHPNGFKVTLQSTTDQSLKYIAVSDANGSFHIDGIEAGTYSVDTEKEGYEWVWMVVDGQLVYFNRLLEIAENQTVQLEIRVSSNHVGAHDGVDITDMSGSPITRIVIPRNATTISLRLYNGAQASHTWALYYDKCFVTSTFDMEYVFSSFNVTEGTLAAGDNIVLIGTVNQKIFESQFDAIQGWIELDDYNSLNDRYKVFDVCFGN